MSPGGLACLLYQSKRRGGEWDDVQMVLLDRQDEFAEEFVPVHKGFVTGR